MSISTERLKQRLLEEGMNENLVKECEQIMLSEFSEMHGQVKLLHEERTNLLDALRQLEVNLVYFSYAFGFGLFDLPMLLILSFWLN